jgi:YggT family protein
MSPLSQAALLLINTIGSLVLLVIIMRFLLQLVRADFYNPLSQMIVKFTNPLLLPLRRIIPGFGGLDVASLVLAIIAQYLLITLLLVVMTGSFNLPWIAMIGWSVVGLASIIFGAYGLYFWALVITVVASWVAPNSYNPILILANQILEPVMRPIKKIMPDMGGLDLSPLIFFLALNLFSMLLLKPAAAILGLPQGLLPGL